MADVSHPSRIRHKTSRSRKEIPYFRAKSAMLSARQRSFLCDSCGVKALCDHVVFKKSVEPVKYMPIDILIKENIDFYFEFV